MTILQGDCREQLANIDASTVDACVTDPPYELGFMGKAWDASGVAYDPTLWAEVYRVLKPGGHLLAFGGTRTYHRLACAIEDAGFEIRDSIAAWVYGAGFPKSLDISKAIDKAAGAERTIRVAPPDRRKPNRQRAGDSAAMIANGPGLGAHPGAFAPATAEAARWEGWGTALKPAWEPIIVARKPLTGTVAQNVGEWGVGGLNIDGCRVAGVVPQVTQGATDHIYGSGRGLRSEPSVSNPHAAGRWPANTVLAHHPGCGDNCHPDCWVRTLDQQSGNRPGASSNSCSPTDNGYHGFTRGGAGVALRPGYGDTGGASRFFPTFRYEAKAPGRERPKVDGIAHPTVKPLALIRWLCRLVTPPDGTVLDPFLGSGTTAEACELEGFRWVGCEQNTDYLPLIRHRLDRVGEVQLQLPA